MGRHFNVWLDVKPSQGHRVVMQTYPGGIQSGTDYYMNDAGLIVTETTIAQTKFDPEGIPLASRIRRVLQYADSIDSAVAILSNRNNGLYSNEWLLADTKANEIAMVRAGDIEDQALAEQQERVVRRDRRFLLGCNNAKDLGVRLETIPSVEGKPANLVFRASDRDHAWLSLYAQAKGKIDADFASRAFTHAAARRTPFARDVKFTTTAMARELKSRVLWGPPIGRTWEPTDAQRDTPGIRPLVPNDWATLTVEAPAADLDDRPVAVDIAGTARGIRRPRRSRPRPRLARHDPPPGDADTWLAAAFADYEKIAAMETALAPGAGRSRSNWPSTGPGLAT